MVDVYPPQWNTTVLYAALLELPILCLQLKPEIFTIAIFHFVFDNLISNQLKC